MPPTQLPENEAPMIAPVCTLYVAGERCGHGRTVPDDETPEQRAELGPRWVGHGGAAVCACHTIDDAAAQYGGHGLVDGLSVMPAELFPCDASRAVLVELDAVRRERWAVAEGADNGA